MFSLPKQNLIEVLENIRVNKCCPNVWYCSCTSGGKGVDSGYWHSEDKGCYELKLVIELLEKLTNKEYKEILRRKEK